MFKCQKKIDFSHSLELLQPCLASGMVQHHEGYFQGHDYFCVGYIFDQTFDYILNSVQGKQIRTIYFKIFCLSLWRKRAFDRMCQRCRNRFFLYSKVHSSKSSGVGWTYAFHLRSSSQITLESLLFKNPVQPPVH